MSVLLIWSLRVWVVWAFGSTVGVLFRWLSSAILLLIIRLDIDLLIIDISLLIFFIRTFFIIIILLIISLLGSTICLIVIIILILIFFLPICISMLSFHDMLVGFFFSFLFFFFDKLLVVDFLLIQVALWQAFHHLSVLFGFWGANATVFGVELAFELLFDAGVDVGFVQYSFGLVVSFPDVFLDGKDFVGFVFVLFLHEGFLLLIVFSSYLVLL